MRLLNTKTLELQEFIGDIPYYAILSHRWENEEVTFQDLRDGKGPSMAGYSKIVKCCEQAFKDSWEYAWIDCCCIDKSSSAELSEAINSMFQWYQDAQVCYAYLSDVEYSSTGAVFQSDFQASIWFTRGWTLQELLAPHTVVFFNQNWEDIGTKYTLGSWISLITGIADLFDFNNASIAQKMSWVATRHTTRVEDKAYCLLGLFGINMPLLYGEGSKAFMRLQLEILKISDDESIFVWGPTRRFCGLLADDASFFKNSGDVLSHKFFQRKPYSMTNKGLSIEICTIDSIGDWYFIPRATLLNCAIEKYPTSPLTINLLLDDEYTCYRPMDDRVTVYKRHALSTKINGALEPTYSELEFKLVHFKQQAQITRVMESSDLVHISLATIVASGFQVSDQEIDFTSEIGVSGLNSKVWESAPSYIKLQIESGDIAAILFYRGDNMPAENFVLILNHYRGRFGSHLQIIDRYDWPIQWPKIEFNYALNYLPDRAERTFPSGLTVSATVKRQVNNKQLDTVVDILAHDPIYHPR